MLLLSYIINLVSTLSLSLQIQLGLKKLYIRGGNLTTLDKGKFGKLVGADFMFEVLKWNEDELERTARIIFWIGLLGESQMPRITMPFRREWSVAKFETNAIKAVASNTSSVD